jgi:hypothetical protein
LNYTAAVVFLVICALVATTAITLYVSTSGRAAATRILDRTGGTIVRLLADGSLLVTRARTTPKHCARRTPHAE